MGKIQSRLDSLKIIKDFLPDWLVPMGKCKNNCGNITWGRKMGSMIVPLKDENKEDVYICGDCLIDLEERRLKAENIDAAKSYKEMIDEQRENRESGRKNNDGKIRKGL